MSQTIEMPRNYMRCTATEGSCPLRENCLRSKVHREAEYDSDKENRGLRVVNLWNPTIKPLTTECQAYRTAESKMFAKGFNSLFDAVPRGVYATVRKQVEHVFSNRLFYFKCKKGTRLTSPEEQESIAQIFKSNGVATEPQYDEFVEVYNWN